MTKPTAATAAALPVLDVLEVLSGYAVHGVSNTALAQALHLPPSQITRAMQTLVAKGWARKDEASGLFHPTPRMGQVFFRVVSDIEKAERRLSDLKFAFSTQ